MEAAFIPQFLIWLANSLGQPCAKLFAVEHGDQDGLSWRCSVHRREQCPTLFFAGRVPTLQPPNPTLTVGRRCAGLLEGDGAAGKQGGVPGLLFWLAHPGAGHPLAQPAHGRLAPALQGASGAPG